MDRSNTHTHTNSDANEQDADVNLAASAGSESPEEGDAAMKAAEDAVVDDKTPH